MSCPYFEPVEPLDAPGERLAMLPLGGAWSGVCRANSCEAPGIADAAARQLCNLGYARGLCPRFPDDAGPDAVRFALAADSGDSLTVRYAIERDHQPYTHGELELCASGGAGGSLLLVQAHAYVANYLRRAGRAAPTDSNHAAR